MIRRLPYVALFILLSLPAMAQSTLPKEVRTKIAATLTNCAMEDVVGCYVKLDDLRIRESKGRTSVEVYASVELAYVPMRHEKVDSIYAAVRAALPAQYNTADLYIYADGELIDRLIPQYFDTQNNNQRFVYDSCAPLLRPISNLSRPSAGLKNRHIALWQSHGRYFNNRTEKWSWQRSCIWETVEDLYTQSYVIPYLVPMLERAGAVVLLPRERSMRREEIILDNDKATTYVEQSRRYEWSDAGYGFTHNYDSYSLGHNPFMDGTSRKVETVTDGKRKSTAVWSGNIPERGIYTLYVAYTSLPTSVSDAHYIVHSLGGDREFRINQRMGGGMWVALGEFEFEAGENQPLVSIVNDSMEEGVITADAIKIGGGMGNMSRGTGDKTSTSGYPRFTEGARYWLQWSGFAEDVYAPKQGTDDYKEDYMSRAHWVEELMGGSEHLYSKTGKRIPIDLAFAFHSDAGVRLTDEVIGTLGIYSTAESGGSFEDSTSRMRSRDLTDLIMTQIVNDIRTKFEPEWRRRGMWDRRYYEARMTPCPTMLLELLSHQNFADMRYGLDPTFRFTVSRAIYKGMLRYLSSQYEYEYVVQPLPVNSFCCELRDDEAYLTWEPTTDDMEPTAQPDYYILYTRAGDGGFDTGRRVDSTSISIPLDEGVLYSFRLTAVNRGGESFDSEILAVGRARRSRATVLVVNGFTRLSAPASEASDSVAGFYNDRDSGVPYIYDASFMGKQHIFDRGEARNENDSKALGASERNFEGSVIAGNTFDYVALHGRSIMAAGYSFASSSRMAVESGAVKLNNYDAVDLILGKQLTSTVARGVMGYEYECFGDMMQQRLEEYAEQGGNILISGCYALHDLWHSPIANDDDRAWARRVLRAEYGGSEPISSGAITGVAKQLSKQPERVTFDYELSPKHYAIERRDIVLPATEDASTALHYDDALSAAVVCRKQGYRSVVLGFPLELISDYTERNTLMSNILKYMLRRR